MKGCVRGPGGSPREAEAAVARQDRRIRRQFEAFARSAPGLAGTIRSLLDGRLRWVRIPMGVLFVVGGFLAVLPVFGLWMIPLGLLLLALDIPALQPATAAAVIRGRRRVRASLSEGGWLKWLRDLWGGRRRD